MHQFHTRLCDIPGYVGRGLQPLLPADVLEIGIPDDDLYGGAFQAAAPQPGGHLIGELRHTGVQLRPAHQITGKGEPVAHGLGPRQVPRGDHRGALGAGGVIVKGISLLAQKVPKGLPVEPGQIPDGTHAVPFQRPPGGLTHKEQVAHRQRPQQVPEIFPRDDGGGVRLFVIAAHFGKDLVERHPHRYGQLQLLPNRTPDLVGQGPAVPAEQMQRAGHVQPALVDGEGLHQIGIALIDGVDLFGIVPVLPMMGAQQRQVRAFPAGLPDGLGGLHAERLGAFVLGQNDPVAGFRVPAYRDRGRPQLRMLQQLHRGVKAVQIAV